MDSSTQLKQGLHCPIVRFYDPAYEANDSHGRTLQYILSMTDSWLEGCHNYIQWLFPLPEASAFGSKAPVLSPTTFHAFRARLDLRTAMRHSLKRMCLFYGFDFHRDPLEADSYPQITRRQDGSFEASSKYWLMSQNHNHLRMTRIIRSLRILGLEDEARVFFNAIQDVHREKDMFSPQSVEFWGRAMERPLYLAPYEEQDVGNGKFFLYDFEKDRKKRMESFIEQYQLSGEPTEATEPTPGVDSEQGADGGHDNIARPLTPGPEHPGWKAGGTVGMGC